MHEASSAPGLADLVESLRRIRIAFYLAWGDTRARYLRSVLGPLWLTLGTAIGVVGLGFLWSELLKIDRANFVPSLTAGLIIWQLISACMTEGTAVFVRQANIIRNLQLPYFLHPLQLVLRHFVNFLHNLLLYVAVAVWFAVPVTASTFLVVPGILLVALNLLWMVLLLGMLGARFRDVEYAVASLIPLLLFVSPVFYRPDYLPFNSALVWLNPFSHLIEAIRDPLMGQTPPWFVYATLLVMLIAGWSFTLWLFNGRRNRIAFWL
jgi:lipopolysaccharide transport system permease protein